MKRWYAGILVLTGTISAGCGAPPVVNGGSSVPRDERPAAERMWAVEDQTDVVAYEYGRCSSHEECVPAGCQGAVCAPPGEIGMCLASPAGACLATLSTALCGCVEGYCRWARRPEVLRCAALNDRPFGNIGHGIDVIEPYPIDPQTVP